MPMSNIPDDCIDYTDPNPDISGVGVRVSFYLQTFLLVLLVDRSWQDAPIALWTFIATSAGLTLAAIVQREHLTLFEALQISNLVWLANFGTFVALASYSRQKAASHKDTNSRLAFDYKVKFGAMAQTLVSMALTLYMWAKAKTFGQKAECSPLVTYMLFVIEVSALGTGRIVGLVVTSILTTGYTAITLHELHSYRRSALNETKKSEQAEILPTHIPSLMLTVPSPSTGSPSNPVSPSITTVSSGQQDFHSRAPDTRTPIKPQPPQKSPHKHRPKRRRWSSNLDPMLVGIIICQVMVFTYFVVSTELLLKYNPSHDNTAAQWSFGQILALIVVIPSALSLAGAIKEHGVERLSKRKKSTKTRKGPKGRRRIPRLDNEKV